jgi:hypothetical protein
MNNTARRKHMPESTYFRLLGRKKKKEFFYEIMHNDIWLFSVLLALLYTLLFKICWCHMAEVSAVEINVDVIPA